MHYVIKETDLGQSIFWIMYVTVSKMLLDAIADT